MYNNAAVVRSGESLILLPALETLFSQQIALSSLKMRVVDLTCRIFFAMFYCCSLEACSFLNGYDGGVDLGEVMQEDEEKWRERKLYERRTYFYFLKSKSQSILVLLFDTWNVGRRSLGKTGLNMVSNKISCRFIFRSKSQLVIQDQNM